MQKLRFNGGGLFEYSSIKDQISLDIDLKKDIVFTIKSLLK